MEPVPSDTLEVTVEDLVYLRHGALALQARLYRPQGPGPFPAVAEIHGGAWCRGGRLDEDGMNRRLAARGIVVVALDFRMPPQAGYPASLADIHYAVRWIKSSAQAWRADPGRVSLLGVSSGAHQAMLVAMRPDDPRYAAIPPPAGSPGTDARVASVVMGWPVIDPAGRYRYALELRAAGGDYPEAIDRVIPDHLKFWGDEAAMAEGSPLRILERGERIHAPPVLCLQGEADRVHPRAHLERFADAYARAGGTMTLHWFPGEAEGFIGRKPDGESAVRAVDEIARFLRAAGRPAPA